MSGWTYKLFNAGPLRIRADIYFEGQWTGLSNGGLFFSGEIQAQAEIACKALNLAQICRFRDISLISVENNGICVHFGPFSSISVYYWPKSLEKREK